MTWIWWALLSAVAAGLTSVFAKAGLEDVPPNIGNAIRTAMILAMTAGICVVTGEAAGLPKLSGRAWLMLTLSAVTTAVSWVAFFHALASGPATPVTAIDRASLVVTMIVAVSFFAEPFGVRTLLGVLMVVAGAGLASIPAR